MNHEFAMSDSNRTGVTVPTISEIRAARRSGAEVTSQSLQAARRTAMDLRSTADASTESFLNKNAALLKRNADLLIENSNLDRALRAAKKAEVTLRRLMLKQIS